MAAIKYYIISEHIGMCKVAFFSLSVEGTLTIHNGQVPVLQPASTF